METRPHTWLRQNKGVWQTPPTNAIPKAPSETRSVDTKSSPVRGNLDSDKEIARTRLVELGETGEGSKEDRMKADAAQEAIAWKLKELARPAQGARRRWEKLKRAILVERRSDSDDSQFLTSYPGSCPESGAHESTSPALQRWQDELPLLFS